MQWILLKFPSIIQVDQLECSASRRRWAQGTTFDTIYGVRIMKYRGTVCIQYEGAEEEDYF